MSSSNSFIRDSGRKDFSKLKERLSSSEVALIEDLSSRTWSKNAYDIEELYLALRILPTGERTRIVYERTDNQIASIMQFFHQHRLDGSALLPPQTLLELHDHVEGDTGVSAVDNLLIRRLASWLNQESKRKARNTHSILPRTGEGNGYAGTLHEQTNEVLKLAEERKETGGMDIVSSKCSLLSVNPPHASARPHILEVTAAGTAATRPTPGIHTRPKSSETLTLPPAITSPIDYPSLPSISVRYPPLPPCSSSSSSSIPVRTSSPLSFSSSSNSHPPRPSDPRKRMIDLSPSSPTDPLAKAMRLLRLDLGRPPLVPYVEARGAVELAMGEVQRSLQARREAWVEEEMKRQRMKGKGREA